MNDDTIYRQAAIDEVHGAIYEFFDFCEDDEESPITHKDEQLLELNKAITIRIKQLPSARPKGKWLEIHIYPDTHEGHTYGTCSNCLRVRIVDNFCSNCGADMREVEE